MGCKAHLTRQLHAMPNIHWIHWPKVASRETSVTHALFWPSLPVRPLKGITNPPKCDDAAIVLSQQSCNSRFEDNDLSLKIAWHTPSFGHLDQYSRVPRLNTPWACCTTLFWGNWPGHPTKSDVRRPYDRGWHATHEKSYKKCWTYVAQRTMPKDPHQCSIHCVAPEKVCTRGQPQVLPRVHWKKKKLCVWPHAHVEKYSGLKSREIDRTRRSRLTYGPTRRLCTMKTRRGCPRHPKKAAFPGHMRGILISPPSEPHLSLGSSRIETGTTIYLRRGLTDGRRGQSAIEIWYR